MNQFSERFDDGMQGAPEARPPMLIAADIFGVLVGLDTRTWRARLADIGGLTQDEFMTQWRASGLGEAWDSGILTLEHFAAKLSDLLAAPHLTPQAVSALWFEAVGSVDRTLGPIAARLSREQQLILASNNNPAHWPIVERLLADSGISPDTPAVLSHQVGASKPDHRFYAALAQATEGRDVVFIDDRLSNVEAAADFGINAFHHTDPALTAAMLTELLGLTGLASHPGGTRPATLSHHTAGSNRPTSAAEN